MIAINRDKNVIVNVKSWRNEKGVFQISVVMYSNGKILMCCTFNTNDTYTIIMEGKDTDSYVISKSSLPYYKTIFAHVVYGNINNVVDAYVEIINPNDVDHEINMMVNEINKANKENLPTLIRTEVGKMVVRVDNQLINAIL